MNHPDLRTIREKRLDWTRAQMAEALWCSAELVRSMEYGRRRVTYRTAKRLRQILAEHERKETT